MHSVREKSFQQKYFIKNINKSDYCKSIGVADCIEWMWDMDIDARRNQYLANMGGIIMEMIEEGKLEE